MKEIFDQTLEDILSLEGIWKEKGGKVTLEELGIRPMVSTKGSTLPIPEHWKFYPVKK